MVVSGGRKRRTSKPETMPKRPQWTRELRFKGDGSVAMPREDDKSWTYLDASIGCFRSVPLRLRAFRTCCHSILILACCIASDARCTLRLLPITLGLPLDTRATIESRFVAFPLGCCVGVAAKTVGTRRRCTGPILAAALAGDRTREGRGRRGGSTQGHVWRSTILFGPKGTELESGNSKTWEIRRPE